MRTVKVHLTVRKTLDSGKAETGRSGQRQERPAAGSDTMGDRVKRLLPHSAAVAEIRFDHPVLSAGARARG